MYSQCRTKPLHKLLLVERPLGVPFPVLHPVGSTFKQNQFEWGADFLEFSSVFHCASVEFILGPLDEKHRRLVGSRVKQGGVSLQRLPLPVPEKPPYGRFLPVRTFGPLREVIHTVERNHCLYLTARARFRSSLRHQLAACGFTEQGDAGWVNMKAICMRANVTDCGANIFQLLGNV